MQAFSPESIQILPGGGYISIRPECKLKFAGKAVIAGGFSIRLDNCGIIEFGKNFVCNSYCFFASNSLMKFGDDCVLGWKVNIRDADGHKIFYINDNNEQEINTPRNVIIGNHVWIGANTDILKGTHIGDDCIIAYGTLLTGQCFNSPNAIIGGNPPRVLKEKIGWSF